MADNGSQEPENYGMPPNWAPIDAPPIVPGQAQSSAPPNPPNNQYNSGVLPPNLGLQTDVASNDYGPGTPIYRLTPPYGGPQENSRIQTIVEKAVAAAPVPTPTPTPTEVDLTMPSSVFAVAGSGTDNLVVTFINQTGGTVFAAPAVSVNLPTINAQFVLVISNTGPYVGTETLAAGQNIHLNDTAIVMTQMLISGGSTTGVATVADSKGNTYSAVGTAQSLVNGGNHLYIQLWQAPQGTAVSSGGSVTYTLTLNGTPTVSSIDLSLISVANLASLDNVTYNNNTTGNASNNIITTGDNELVIFIVGAQSGLSANPNAPFTLLNPFGTTGGNTAQGAYTIATPTTVNGSWNISGGFSWISIMASFLPTTSGSSSGVPTFRALQQTDLPTSFLLSRYTVLDLPTGSEGQIAYATNGLKVGESAGSGTGVPVYFSNAEWRVYSTDAQVQS